MIVTESTVCIKKILRALKRLGKKARVTQDIINVLDDLMFADW
jgi:hypothetical protein